MLYDAKCKFDLTEIKTFEDPNVILIVQLSTFGGDSY